MLDTLQAARALASLCVLLFHLSIMMGVARYGGVAAFSDVTASLGGVRFFFVLSGFILLIAHARDIAPVAAPLRTRLAAWRHYLWRRCIRIYPLYWLYTLVFTGLVLLGTGTEARIPDNLADWVTSLTLIRFTPAQPPFPVAWSLFHEMAFYVVFSVLVLNRRAGIACFAVWSVICLAFYGYAPVEGRTAWAVYTGAYNLYFVLGMGAWWLWRRGGTGTVELLAGAGVVAVAAVLVRMHQPGYLLMMGGFALLLAGAAKRERAGRVRVPRWLVAIGNASYSLYLIHEHVAGVLLKVAMRSGLYQYAGPHATYLVVVAGTTLGGITAYRLIERPLLSLLRRTERKPVPVVAAPAAAGGSAL
ncbi:peptidoglycan/LPS O-acetylase OafA/YrhL [Pseudoduganella flava]|uniref:Acyltransferase family protein n=1 Tax=Pseudoduganella flava TaxID=871742 RepID=A0A562PH56_9BURK|nr:acyltransferase [Pseudoduganella flava]QGZ42608.1 acyltransferase family protein [Pseudoduganella flava]TWI43764.1 peptidoglycan/LPS O-acetylase OafA/YrhL [Pseudoduganella flava]